MGDKFHFKSGEDKMVMPNNNRRQNARNFIAHPAVYLPSDQRPRFLWPSQLYRYIVNQPPGEDEALRRNQPIAYNPSVVNGRGPYNYEFLYLPHGVLNGEGQPPTVPTFQHFVRFQANPETYGQVPLATHHQAPRHEHGASSNQQAAQPAEPWRDMDHTMDHVTQHQSQGTSNPMVMCVVGRQNEPRRYIGVRVDEDMEVKVQGGARPKIVIQKVQASGQQVQDQSSYMTQESVEKQSSEANGVESKPQRDVDQKDQQDIQGQAPDTNQGSTNMQSPMVHEPLDQTRSNREEQLEKLMRRHLEMKAMIYNMIEAQTQEILSFMEKQASTEKHQVNNEDGNGRYALLKPNQKGKMEVLVNNLTEDWAESSGAKDKELCDAFR